MKKLILFGADDYAEVANYLFEHDTDYTVECFSVDQQYLKQGKFCGKPVVAFEDIEKYYPPSQFEMFLAIGYSGVNSAREKKYNEAKEKGYHLASYISSKATVWDTLRIGDNSFVFENNNIQPFVIIGNNVVLWSGNHVGHHSIVEDHVFITSHVVVSGRCVVGHNSFLGVNSTLNDHVMLAPRTVVGSGALITCDTEEGCVYKAQKTEKYKKTSDELFYFSK